MGDGSDPARGTEQPGERNEPRTRARKYKKYKRLDVTRKAAANRTCKLETRSSIDAVDDGSRAASGRRRERSSLASGPCVGDIDTVNSVTAVR